MKFKIIIELASQQIYNVNSIDFGQGFTRASIHSYSTPLLHFHVLDLALYLYLIFPCRYDYF